VLAVARKNTQALGVADPYHLRPGGAFETDFGGGGAFRGFIVPAPGVYAHQPSDGAKVGVPPETAPTVKQHSTNGLVRPLLRAGAPKLHAAPPLSPGS
jgi:hypothetical protein